MMADGPYCILQAPPTIDSGYVLLYQEIGQESQYDGWPTNDIEGLFDALQRWRLAPHYLPIMKITPLHCGGVFVRPDGTYIVEPIEPRYSDHPEAIKYQGDFVECGWRFEIDTADVNLIKRLEDAIHANLSRAHV